MLDDIIKIFNSVYKPIERFVDNAYKNKYLFYTLIGLILLLIYFLFFS